MVGVNPIMLESNKCLRVALSLDDTSNENSAFFSYFEGGAWDLKTELINMIVMQALEQPFFNEMRTN